MGIRPVPVLSDRRVVLPDGKSGPTPVGGSVKHVNTPGVHVLGHLENLVEFVVQRRFASRSRQRIVT
jgi:hypothetical protein